MGKTYMFAPVFRKIGYVLLSVALLFFVACMIWKELLDISYPMFSLTPGVMENFDEPAKFFNPRILNGGWFEIFMTMMCVGCVFVAFSKEKVEDECITQIRMNSLIWSLLVNMVFVLISTLFVYGWSYLIVMAVYPFSTFFLFMIKYNISLYKFRKSNEE